MEVKMDISSARSLRQELTKRDIIPFIGVYDVFSASIAAKYYDGIFTFSGFQAVEQATNLRIHGLNHGLVVIPGILLDVRISSSKRLGM